MTGAEFIFKKLVHASKGERNGGICRLYDCDDHRAVVWRQGGEQNRHYPHFEIQRIAGWRWLALAVLLPFTPTAIVGFYHDGLGVSCIIPLVFSLAGQLTKTSSGAAIASVSTIGYFGFLAVPPSVGFIAEVLGCNGLLASSLCWDSASFSLY